MGRRSKSEYPVHRRHGASKRGYVTIDGQQLYTGPWPDPLPADPSPEAEAKYRQIVARWVSAGRKLVADPKRDGRSPTIASLVPLYIKHVRGYYVKDFRDGRGPVLTSHGGQIIRIMHRLMTFFGPSPAAEFERSHLELLRDDWIANGYCRTTVNGYVEHVRVFFGWAAKRRDVPASLPQELKLLENLKKGRSPAPDRPKVRTVPEDSIRAVLDRITSPRIRDMLALQAVTGMRPGEVRMMRASEIDRSLEGEHGVWIYRPQAHKTIHLEEDRVVVLGTKAQAILAPYLAGMKAGRDFVFVNRRGNVYPGEYYARVVRVARRRAGLDDQKFTPNVMRHNRATEIRAKYGLEAAQVVLGHKSRETTERYYAEICLEEAIRAARESG